MAVTLPRRPNLLPSHVPLPAGCHWWRSLPRRHQSHSWRLRRHCSPRTRSPLVWPASIPSRSTISSRRSTQIALWRHRRSISRRISMPTPGQSPQPTAMDRYCVTLVPRPVRWRFASGTSCCTASVMLLHWDASWRRKRTPTAPAAPWRRPSRCWPIRLSRMNSLWVFIWVLNYFEWGLSS